MKREFVSYPKSGRTWIRYVLYQLGLGQEIHFHHDDFEFNDGNKPPLDFDVERRIRRYTAGEKIIYLERDPRDIMVSLYHQITGRFKDFFAYRGTMSSFIRDPYFGADNLRRFRAMWRAIAAEKGYLTISYENCHRDTKATLLKLLAYYELQVDGGRLDRAIKNAEFSRMKELEQSGAFAEPWLRPRHAAPKIREGKVGGFRNALSEEDIAYLDGMFIETRPQTPDGNRLSETSP